MTVVTLTFSTSSPHSSNGASNPDITWSLPASLSPTFSASGSSSQDGLSLNYTMDVSAGLSGSLQVADGDYSLRDQVTIDPGLPTGTIADGSVFQVDPTVVSQDAETLGLTGPSVTAHLVLGAAGSVDFLDDDVTFAFHATASPTFSTANFDLAEAPGASTLASSPGGSSSLAPIASSLTGGAFLSASEADLLQLLDDLLGSEVSSKLSGSSNSGAASLSYDVLTSQLAGNLALDDTLTVAPTGIAVTVQEQVNGQVVATDAGTVGQFFSFLAPNSGSGIIQIDETYALNYQVTSDIGVVGSLSLTLEGPTVSGDVMGQSLSVAPFVTSEALNVNGLGTIESASYSGSLQTSDVYDLAYGTATIATPTLIDVSNGAQFDDAMLAVSNAGADNGTAYTIDDTATTPLVETSTPTADLTGGDSLTLDGAGATIEAAPAEGALILAAGAVTIEAGVTLQGGSSTGNDLGQGLGVNVNGGTLTNAGIILGGAGGGGAGDYGATAVNLNGGTLTNTGTIEGGAGGNSAGVYINGGHLINAGLIEANPTTDGNGGSQAVLFNGAGTLTVDPGASFVGAVQAGASDTLELAGASAGSLSGLGSQLTNFGKVTFDAGSQWTLSGTAAGFASVAEIVGFAAGDVVDLTGVGTETSASWGSATC